MLNLTPAELSHRSLNVTIRLQSIRVLGYIRRIIPVELQSLHDPADLHQETMFEAFRRAPRFRHADEASTRAWLFLLARRQVGMARRRERRLKRGGGRLVAPVGRAAGADELFDALSACVACRRSPSQSAAHHELVLAVERALGEIPPHLARAVRLRYLHEASPAQVASALGRSERAAATLCLRGIRLLRRKLGPAVRDA